jgi:hypothetical protein
MLSRCLALAAILAFGLACASSPPPTTCAPSSVALEPPARADLTKLTNEQLASKLLELSGAANLGKQVMDGMTESMKKLPGLPPGFLEQFRNNAHPEELTALVIPIYVRNFDRETMMAAIQFYESKYGRILVAQTPIATKESMEAGREWGRKLAEKTLREMGLTPPNAP